MADIKLLCGTKDEFDAKAKNVLGTIYLTTVDNARSYLYYGNGTNFLNIVPELLTVANGGTGRNTLDAGYALIGNGTQPVALRAITNNETLTYITPNTNLITANTLKNWNGAYDAAGASNIQYLGTISKGTWAASVIAVSYGGTGAKKFTTNGVLYGNDINAIQASPAGTDGQIFSTVNKKPQFLTPTITWTAAINDSSGPTIQFKLSQQSYSATIPAANGAVNAEAAGVVTKGAQSFAGNKTFMGAILTSNIYPRTSNTYTSGTQTAAWKNVYSVDYDVRDTNNIQVGRFASTTTAADTNSTGVTSLYIGNNKAKGTAGNARGYIYIYSNSTGYTKFQKIDNSTDTSTVTLPDLGGNMLLSNDTNTENSNEEKTYNIPFYIDNYKRVSMNDGICLTSLQGTTSRTGYSFLVLGNATPGDAAGNKFGGIKLYSTTANYNNIIAHPETGTATIRLPKITTGAEFIYHGMNESIGSTSQAVFIGADGKPDLVTTMAVSYGGTGKNTFTTNGVLYGNGTGAINVTTAGGQGTILSPNAANVPSFAEPSWSWSGGTTEGPTLTLTLQSKGWTTPAIPKASSTASGIVTTGSQTFAGAKTFSGATKVTSSATSSSKTTGALIVTGGVGIGGSLYANAISSTTSLSAGTSLTVGGAGTIGGDLTVNGGEIYLGTTSEHCTMSYDTTTDTLTISFPS